jgi:tetratricopeptide (TPR) repeat protein
MLASRKTSLTLLAILATIWLITPALAQNLPVNTPGGDTARQPLARIIAPSEAAQKPLVRILSPTEAAHKAQNGTPSAAPGKPPAGNTSSAQSSVNTAAAKVQPGAKSETAAHARNLQAKGVARMKAGDTNGALGLLTQAAQADPNLAEVRVDLALALMYAGRDEEAKEQLVVATRLRPDVAQTWELLGQCCLSIGKSSDAEKAFRQAIALNPASPAAAEWQKLRYLADQELLDKRVNPMVLNPEDYFYLTVRKGAIRWRPDSMPIRFFIKHPHQVPSYRDNFKFFLKEAFKEWAAGSNGLLRFEETSDAASAQIVCAWSEYATSETSANEGSDVQYQFANNKLKKVNVTFLTRNGRGWPVSDAFVRRVVLHGIGHALGLREHSYNSNDIMFFRAKNNMSGISDRDKRTLIRLYSADAQKATPIPDNGFLPNTPAATYNAPYTPEQLGTDPGRQQTGIANAKASTAHAEVPEAVTSNIPLTYASMGQQPPNVNPIETGATNRQAVPPVGPAAPVVTNMSAAGSPNETRPAVASNGTSIKLQYQLPSKASTTAGNPQTTSQSLPTSGIGAGQPTPPSYLNSPADQLESEAQAAMKEMDFTAGLALMERACRADSTPSRKKALALAYGRAANFQWSSENFSQAEKYFQKGIAILNSIGERSGCEELLSEHQKFLPSYAASLGHQGYKELQRGNYEIALEKLKHSMQIEPNAAPETLCNYGIVLMHTGEAEKGITYIRKSIAHRPDFAPAYADMGKCYARLGRSNEALDAYRKCLDLDPAGPTAATAKQEIARLSAKDVL